MITDNQYPFPVAYLTNFSSSKLMGPADVYTIMARPRRWEHGDGTVRALCPLTNNLAAVRSGAMSASEYRRRYLQTVKLNSEGGIDLQHPRLRAYRGGRSFPVASGSTLCCGCARAKAARGLCHRVWAASSLHRAGWVVVLDGELYIGDAESDDHEFGHVLAPVTVPVTTTRGKGMHAWLYNCHHEKVLSYIESARAIVSGSKRVIEIYDSFDGSFNWQYRHGPPIGQMVLA